MRAVLDQMRIDARGERVLLVVHQVVVLLTRYVLEQMDEQTILAIDAEADVANCSVTSYALDRDSGRLMLERYNETTALDDDQAPVTSGPDTPLVPR